MGVSENVVYPEKPNGFADHYPVFKWLAIIGNINPTFSDKAIWENMMEHLGSAIWRYVDEMKLGDVIGIEITIGKLGIKFNGRMWWI